MTSPAACRLMTGWGGGNGSAGNGSCTAGPTDQTGLCHTHVALDPEADARVSAVLDAAVAAERAKPETERRTFDQLRADAFVAAFTGPRCGSSAARLRCPC